MSDEEPCESTFDRPFPIFCEASGAAEPSEGALTTHRRGRTAKPFAQPVRLMISIVQSPIFAHTRRSLRPAYPSLICLYAE